MSKDSLLLLRKHGAQALLSPPGGLPILNGIYMWSSRGGDGCGLEKSALS
jgi:hypothetical protein